MKNGRQDAGVAGTPLAVLLALTTFTDDYGANASPSTNELAAKTGRSPRTTTQAIQTLTRAGIIQSETMAGHHNRNLYTILKPPTRP